jgi:lipoprotein-anchoring transpeptidase ErfK/SrfK
MRLPLPSLATTRSRALLVAIPTVAVVAVVAVVVATTHGSSSTQGRISGGSTSAPPVSFSAPHIHGTTLAFKRHLTFEVTNGAITTVNVTRGNGKAIAGHFDTTHSQWRSTDSFAPLTTINASVTYADLAHKLTTKTYKLKTTDSPKHFTAILSPGAGDTVGIASPVIVQFSQAVPTSRRAAVERHLTVTAKPAVIGAWHWMSDTEVHWRPPMYWKSGSKVTIHSDLQDVSLGHGTWGVRGAHQTTFKIGASHISEVNIATHEMKVYDNGKLIRTLPVSTGREQYPTMDGVHIALDKSAVVQMDSATVGIPKGNPGYYNETVYWDVRISNSGEFVHAAPWSVGEQGNTNVSHGCVNLSTANAEWFYNWALRGDVVDVYDGVRPPLPDDPGTADWNMSWKDWLKGGSAPSAAARALHPGMPRDSEPGFAPVKHTAKKHHAAHHAKSKSKSKAKSSY